MDEAKARWLRPNEIHAILCNYKYFSINVKPVNLPKSKYLFFVCVLRKTNIIVINTTGPGSPVIYINLLNLETYHPSKWNAILPSLVFLANP